MGNKWKRGQAPARERSFRSEEVPEVEKFFGERATRRRKGHRDLQVCEEARAALACAFAELDDALLQGATIVAVEPAPDASRLLVLVAHREEGVSVALLLERLDAARAFLRAEVAAALQRKRTPELAFALRPPDDGGGCEDGDDGGEEVTP